MPPKKSQPKLSKPKISGRSSKKMNLPVEEPEKVESDHETQELSDIEDPQESNHELSDIEDPQESDNENQEEEESEENEENEEPEENEENEENEESEEPEEPEESEENEEPEENEESEENEEPEEPEENEEPEEEEKKKESGKNTKNKEPKKTGFIKPSNSKEKKSKEKSSNSQEEEKKVTKPKASKSKDPFKEYENDLLADTDLTSDSKIKAGVNDIVVVLGMQNDNTVKGSPSGKIKQGDSYIMDAAKAATNVNKLIRKAGDGGMVTLAIKNCYDPTHYSFKHVKPHCVYGTPGWSFFNSTKKAMNEANKAGGNVYVMTKNTNPTCLSYSCIQYTKEHAAMRGLSEKGKKTNLSMTGSNYMERPNHTEVDSSFGLNAAQEAITTDKFLNYVAKDPDFNSFTRGLTKAKVDKCEMEAPMEKMFVCGLPLDLDVADTAISASQLGYEVYIVIDATRPSWTRENGYLNSPNDLLEMIKKYSHDDYQPKLIKFNQITF
jgi:nicotinamidase-related amidase